MTKKLSILLIALVLLPSFMVAQKHMVLRSDGQKSQNGVFIDGHEIQATKINKQAVREFFKDNNNVTDLDKVLFYAFNNSPATNFGFFGQDWFVQWFEAPADMIINRAGFNVNAVASAGLEVGVKLVTMAWTKDQIMNAGVTNWGYYEASGNGYNDISAFEDNDDVTGTWVDVEGGGAGSPFGADLWSDFGGTAPLEPVASGASNVYQWVDMSLLGVVPSVLRGDIVGVAVHHNGATMDADRVGMNAENDLGIPGFKFYTNGRLVPGGPGVGDPGWWSRKYTWDFALDVTLTGDVPPDVNSVTDLPTTLSTADRTVDVNATDTNPAGGAAGVAGVDLYYSIDGGATWTTVAMSGAEPDFTGTLPGQAPGTQVDYYVVATDVAGNTTESQHFGYAVFEATSTNLLVFNGMDKPSGYPQSYYFGQDDFTNYSTVGWDHDVWSFGALTPELLSNYSNVIEITTTGPSVINSTEISAWLAASASNNYALFGDEWLGAQSGWVDGPHVAGEFHFDVLGINYEYNDISYDGASALDGTTVMPQTGTLLGGPLADKYTQVTTDNSWTEPMVNAPKFELGVTNWEDGVDFEADVEVDMTGDNFDGTSNYPILGHRTLPAGNKIVFGTYDPLSLDSDPTNGAEYYWYGFSFSAPQVSMLDWFSIPTDVKQSNEIVPVKFDLSQNYPNPFNPSTIIKFAIPSNESVSLKIYNVLGKEVATLINKTMTAGNYEVNFDASKLTSGMYIYQITAGNFVSAKKMMLLK